MLMFAVILVVSGALIIGALWGLYGRLPSWLEGNLLALAGGALMISVVIELIQPAVTDSGLCHAGRSGICECRLSTR